MNGRSWRRIAIAAVVCLAPAAVECQVTAPSTQGQTRVLSLQTLRPETPWYVTTDRIYRQRLTDALGDRVEVLHRIARRQSLSRPSVRIRLRRLSRAQISQPADRRAARTWHYRDRCGGAPAGAARVAPSHRVHWCRRGTARSEINRPHVRVRDERVARAGAARAPRHTSRVPRVRHITSG